MSTSAVTMLDEDLFLTAGMGNHGRLLDSSAIITMDGQTHTFATTLPPPEAVDIDSTGVTGNLASWERSYRVKRLAPVEPHPRGAARFVLHEMWEGVVEEVCATYFVAQLTSKTLQDTHEVAEIYTSEVSRSDEHLLRSGAVFYWSVGYHEHESGQRVRSSMIRFRRLPAVSPIKKDQWIESVEEAWLTFS